MRAAERCILAMLAEGLKSLISPDGDRYAFMPAHTVSHLNQSQGV